MDKYIYNEKNGLWYELHGDYYLPCLKLPKEESRHIGIWGQRHLRYLKQHQKVLYSELLISGKLNSYIADINEQAEEMFSRLVKQLSEKEGVTEALKAENQMLWVQRMNNIRSAAMEIVSSELIYC
ncbi:MAG: TnpV protein [Lachnospiraceae bacterium]